MRKKHVPRRTCVACRRTGSKRELVRVVRLAAGGVAVDPTGKLSGRGAYLCPQRECWDQVLGGNRLENALKTELTQEEKVALGEYAQGLVESREEELEVAEEARPSTSHP